MDFLDDLENEGILKSNVVYVILSPNFPFFGPFYSSPTNS